jgi:tripartite tricarboxylate transporter family receptor
MRPSALSCYSVLRILSACCYAERILPESPAGSVFPSGRVAGPTPAITNPGPAWGPVFFAHDHRGFVISESVQCNKRDRRFVRRLRTSTVAELIALANKTKEGMLFGATNRGGQAHLTGELFRDRSKANISFVHAAGATASLNDVIAGRIPIMFEGLAGLAPGIQGGSVKVLGVRIHQAAAQPAEPPDDQ